MKTEVTMKRELFGVEVQQRSKSEFFSATDLVVAGNKWRAINDMSPFNFTMWLKTKSTIEFMAELEKEFGKIIVRGKKTWVHPFLFIDLALSISPRLKIEAYKWLYDHLLANRNASGDSYKLMCGNLFAHHGNKRTFGSFVARVAVQIQKICGVSDWQAATEEQLKQRDSVHNDISLLANVLSDNNEAVRLAMVKHQR